MNERKRTSMTLLVLAVVAAFSLQACNTMAGLGKDVSSAADAVTGSAEKHKDY